MLLLLYNTCILCCIRATVPTICGDGVAISWCYCCIIRCFYPYNPSSFVRGGAAVLSFDICGGADTLSLSPSFRCICDSVLTFVIMVYLYCCFDGVVCCHFQLSVFADYARDICKKYTRHTRII